VLAGVKRRVLGLRRLRGRAAEAARSDGAPAARDVRKLPRDGGRPHRGQGQSGGGPIRQLTRSARPTCARRNAALRWLWARRWVQTFEDELAMARGQPAEDASRRWPRLPAADGVHVVRLRSIRRWSTQGGQGQNVPPASADAPRAFRTSRSADRRPACCR
jgi:hypothetical protein